MHPRSRRTLPDTERGDLEGTCGVRRVGDLFRGAQVEAALRPVRGWREAPHGRQRAWKRSEKLAVRRGSSKLKTYIPVSKTDSVSAPRQWDHRLRCRQALGGSGTADT